MNRPLACAGFLLAVFFVSAGCTANLPEFLTVTHRLVVYATDAEGGREERLSVFASIRDDDGKDDVENVYLVCDDAELFWNMNPENWVYKEENDEQWLGANGLQGPQPVLPRGAYRIIAVDKAGERAERSFTLNAPDTSTYGLPQLSYTTGGDSIRLASAYKTNTLFFLDAGNNVVKTATIAPGVSKLTTLWGDDTWKAQAYYLAVYSFDIASETGFFSWKTRLQP